MNYRWYILTLIALTASLAVAAPEMCMPVLFKEISEDLGLSLVQIGTVWGMVPLAGACVILICGLLTDRFGAKRVLTAACFLGGVAGILRGLSNSFATLATTTFLFGFLMTIVAPGMIKACSTWFSGQRLGLANGVLAMSMGLGFMLGAMVSATVLSPLLGGWRNVLFLYGAISIAIGVLWLLSRSDPGHAEPSVSYTSTAPLRHSLSRVVRIRQVWLLGLIVMGHASCAQGMLGYLPVYLRDVGWAEASADGALALFHGASMTATIPIVLLSDRLGSRKVVLFAAMLAMAIGVGLLSVAGGTMAWASVIIAGIVRDGFMAVHMTTVIETERVGVAYTGTAIGITHTISKLGAFFAPPLGNSLAGINPSLPFAFWAALVAAALSCFYFIKEPERGKKGTEGDITLSAEHNGG